MSRSAPSTNPPEPGRETLPDQPALALFVGTLFERLGGTLEIDAEGKRHAWRPSLTRIRRDGPPQLEGARAHERFRSVEEWEGAMKLAQYWLTRLGDADRDLVYTMLAPLPEAVGETFDFRERLAGDE
ncbi:MAG: hypothetical protein KGM17_08110 [Sphingomonadales bacterium]|nr:hypothetical protein [Sphingomonadales bacterium]